MTSEQKDPKKLSNSFWVGAIILSIGTFLLLDRMDIFFFPSWLFSWKVFLIVLGIIIGLNRKFEGIGWLVLILVGTFFFLDDIPGFPFDLDEYALPIGIIIIGSFIAGRAVLKRDSNESKKKMWESYKQGVITDDSSGEDYFDITTVFGGTKKKVFSKHFKGGDTTCFFGGTEIDLTQADFEGTVVIDMVQMFGGVKLVIPANWQLKSNMTNILGGVDDKRNTPQQPLSDKKLILEGFVMFGGVEIKSY